MGKTVATMVGSVIAILTNLVLNFLLIYPVRELSVFGVTFTMWGAGMGVRGAALATVIARFVEMFFVLIYAHLHQERYIFLKGAFRGGGEEILWQVEEAVVIAEAPLAGEQRHPGGIIAHAGQDRLAVAVGDEIRAVGQRIHMQMGNILMIMGEAHRYPPF